MPWKPKPNSFAHFFDELGEELPEGFKLFMAILFVVSCLIALVTVSAIIATYIGPEALFYAGSMPAPIILYWLYRRYRRWLAEKVAEEFK